MKVLIIQPKLEREIVQLERELQDAPQIDVLYLIRAPFTTDVVEVYNRVCNVARGVALMTGTEVEIVFDKACSNLIPNNTLEQVLQKAFVNLELPHYTGQELPSHMTLRKHFQITQRQMNCDSCVN